MDGALRQLEEEVVVSRVAELNRTENRKGFLTISTSFTASCDRSESSVDESSPTSSKKRFKASRPSLPAHLPSNRFCKIDSRMACSCQIEKELQYLDHGADDDKRF